MLLWVVSVFSDIVNGRLEHTIETIFSQLLCPYTISF